jgi:hypothetical protein
MVIDGRALGGKVLDPKVIGTDAVTQHYSKT